MRVLVGTSGYSYKEWKGSFYPQDLSPKDMLRFYGERFRTVEINNTFYRMPSRKVLAAWSEQVPEDFSFVLKASRKITHFRRLKGAGEELEYLLGAAATLGERLGPLLFQLPPNFPQDLERLSGFLDLLPRGTRAALEFRHPSWWEDEVFELLRAHGVALVTADTEEGEGRIVATAGYGYLRLRRVAYDEARLARWAEGVAAQPWERAYVFFKHEDEGTGPRLARRFEQLLA